MNSNSQSKKVLVLGATGGIGSACCQVFREAQHQVIEVSSGQRKHPNTALIGDLKQTSFRNQCVAETNPQIVIASYGRFPQDETPTLDVMNEFCLSVIDLYEKFEAKGGLEWFVVLGSLSAQTTALPAAYMAPVRFKYLFAKRALSDYFRQVMLHRTSKSKIVLMEPGYVRTNFVHVDPKLLEKSRIELIEPVTVARSILQSVESDSSMALTIYHHEHH